MKNILEKELEFFWKWAGFSSKGSKEQYLSKSLQGEWQDDYPYWNNLLDAVNCEIEIFRANSNKKSALLLLEALGIDNESEILLELVSSKLNGEALSFLVLECINFYMSQARWQIADLLKEANVPDKKDILVKLIKNDKSKYVQRRALLSLSKVDPQLAEDCAFQKLLDEDEYLRLIALRVLKKQNSRYLKEAESILQNDSSLLVKDELRKD